MDGQRTADRLRLQGDRADAMARAEARRLALEVFRFTAELDSHQAAMEQIVEDMAPGLLDLPDVGSVMSVVIIRGRPIGWRW